MHLNGTFYVSRAAATYFKSQSSGRYINMTSTSGLVGNFGQANYAAAKLGIAALSKSMALDMANRKGAQLPALALFRQLYLNGPRGVEYADEGRANERPLPTR